MVRKNLIQVVVSALAFAGVDAMAEVKDGTIAVRGRRTLRMKTSR